MQVNKPEVWGSASNSETIRLTGCGTKYLVKPALYFERMASSIWPNTRHYWINLYASKRLLCSGLSVFLIQVYISKLDKLSSLINAYRMKGDDFKRSFTQGKDISYLCIYKECDFKVGTSFCLLYSECQYLTL